jgi:hypothetical protein
MKTLSLIREQAEKHMVFAFGRMNPPTIGHGKLVDKVKDVANKHKADHLVVLSHSQDSKKNPLTAEQKIQHAKRFFPKTNLEAATKASPTLMHHATNIHRQGYHHLTMIAGSDRVEEYQKLLHKYNGKFDDKGNGYHFKSINVVSAGNRDPDAEGAEGMSASKMREHAKNNDFVRFRKGVPEHVSDNHAQELFHHVRQGMNLHESLDRELYMTGRLFHVGDPVEDIVTEQEGVIEYRGTNYVTIKTGDTITKRWLDEVVSLVEPHAPEKLQTLGENMSNVNPDGTRTSFKDLRKPAAANPDKPVEFDGNKDDPYGRKTRKEFGQYYQGLNHGGAVKESINETHMVIRQEERGGRWTMDSQHENAHKAKEWAASIKRGGGNARHLQVHPDDAMKIRNDPNGSQGLIKNKIADHEWADNRKKELGMHEGVSLVEPHTEEKLKTFKDIKTESINPDGTQKMGSYGCKTRKKFGQFYQGLNSGGAVREEVEDEAIDEITITDLMAKERAKANRERMAAEKHLAKVSQPMSKKSFFHIRQPAKPKVDHAAMAQHIMGAVGNAFPDGDPFDHIHAMKQYRHMDGYELHKHLNIAAKKHLGAKSYNHYLHDTWEDVARDNPEYSHLGGNNNPWRESVEMEGDSIQEQATIKRAHAAEGAELAERSAHLLRKSDWASEKHSQLSYLKSKGKKFVEKGGPKVADELPKARKAMDDAFKDEHEHRQKTEAFEKKHGVSVISAWEAHHNKPWPNYKVMGNGSFHDRPKIVEETIIEGISGGMMGFLMAADMGRKKPESNPATNIAKKLGVKNLDPQPGKKVAVADGKAKKKTLRQVAPKKVQEDVSLSPMKHLVNVYHKGKQKVTLWQNHYAGHDYDAIHTDYETGHSRRVTHKKSYDEIHAELKSHGFKPQYEQAQNHGSMLDKQNKPEYQIYEVGQEDNLVEVCVPINNCEYFEKELSECISVIDVQKIVNKYNGYYKE